MYRILTKDAERTLRGPTPGSSCVVTSSASRPFGRRIRTCAAAAVATLLLCASCPSTGRAANWGAPLLAAAANAGDDAEPLAYTLTYSCVGDSVADRATIALPPGPYTVGNNASLAPLLITIADASPHALLHRTGR